MEGLAEALVEAVGESAFEFGGGLAELNCFNLLGPWCPEREAGAVAGAACSGQAEQSSA